MFRRICLELGRFQVFVIFGRFDWKLSVCSGSEKEKSPTSWTERSGLLSASPSCPTPASTWPPRCRSFTSPCRRSRERGPCPGWPRPSRRPWPRWRQCFRGRSAVPSCTDARAPTKELPPGIVIPRFQFVLSFHLIQICSMVALLSLYHAINPNLGLLLLGHSFAIGLKTRIFS